MRGPLCCALLLLTMMLGGCKVSRPSKLERSVVVFTKHHITVRNKSQRNPMAMNAQNLAAGKVAFGHYCVACHGLDGQSTGIPFADAMSPPACPPQKACSATTSSGPSCSSFVIFPRRARSATHLCTRTSRNTRATQ
jgi:hypothetical protein